MDIAIQPGLLSGRIDAPASKSVAHRAFICAALADKPTKLLCGSLCKDVEATVNGLQALGAKIHELSDGFQVFPIQEVPKTAMLHCGESGSTLRFLLPIVGALGVEATFHLEGRLPQRPLSPLWEEMERMGCFLSRPTAERIRCTGRLRPGKYSLTGSVSSQFISGMLLALPLLPGSQLAVTGEVKSQPYIHITTEILDIFGISSHKKFLSPGTFAIEGDWSSAAFFLAANALGSQITIDGLNRNTAQGDRAIANLLADLERPATISADHIPDLIPILSLVAACKAGARFTGIHRLRTKESDRVAAILQMLTALGGRAEADENTLTVYPATLLGGTVDSCNDHRIAMAAAIAATVCKNPVTILGVECVAKSYPQFWAHFRQLGGQYAQL